MESAAALTEPHPTHELQGAATPIASMPASKSQTLVALQNTELNFLVKAPWLLGLFVPPPSWPPEPLTVKAPRLAATVFASAVLLAMLAGGLAAVGLLCVWIVAVALPTACILAPLALSGYLAAWAYCRKPPHLYARPIMSEIRKTNADAARAEERRCREEMEKMEELLKETQCDEALPEFTEHVANATSLAIYGCGESCSMPRGSGDGVRGNAFAFRASCKRSNREPSSLILTLLGCAS